MRRRTESGGFTLFELMVVVAIILMLAALAAPAMSSFFTVSKVEQAATTVKLACRTTQLMSLKGGGLTGLYFDLPSEGLMEIWSCRSHRDGGGVYSGGCPDGEGGVLTSNKPGYYRTQRHSNRPYRLPDGIRVFSCDLSSAGRISWSKFSPTLVGRGKAHWIAYDKNARTVTYKYVVVIDEGTGEYRVVYNSNTRLARSYVMEDKQITQVIDTEVSPKGIWPEVKDCIWPFVHGIAWDGTNDPLE